MGTHALLAPTFMCPQRVQHRLLFFFQASIFFKNLNYFLTQSLLVAAAWCPKALKPCSPPPSHPPTCFGDFIYYLWESILFGDSGFYFSTGFDRYSGKGRGGRGGCEHLVLFYDMLWRIC